jgi:glutamate/tyrosine decarboxylase-like PLP-dependent enzyme
MNRQSEDELARRAGRELARGFVHLPEATAVPLSSAAELALAEAASRLHDNYPYFHPLYVGQMLKPPHPVARLAYGLAMHLNPNNHALDGGRASSAMEKEVVRDLARMFGFPGDTLGHLCGGGTLANFEALWVARELRPGKAIAASAQAHYTHARLSQVLGVPFEKVAVDRRGRLDAADLERRLASGAIGTVVATLGTTAAGTVDPLRDIVALARAHDARVHVDSAYGGYFTLIDTLEASAREAYDAIPLADSIVVDPHKHGLQPYGCGCVLFRDPSAGRFYRHDSPYTYFSSDELHLGEISLECSRAGAAAVALWTTMRALPLERGGEFARGLERGREAATTLHAALLDDARFTPLFAPELDIVVWAAPPRPDATASETSDRARAIFDRAAALDLHLAVATFPRALCEAALPQLTWDRDDLACLRACCMKPEHREWMGEIVRRLGEAAAAV